MRYSLLHSQVVQIQVPCNVQLRAGQVIRLLLENITQGNKVEHVYNELRSGFYMICHLSHVFTPKNFIHIINSSYVILENYIQ